MFVRRVRFGGPARQTAAAVDSDPVSADKNVVVDTTPDFREQALRARIERVDAILYTHAHADHILGLDDVRPYNYRQRAAIPIYGLEETLASIQRVFRYAFNDGPSESTIPRLELHTLDGEPFELFGLEFTPIRLPHGKTRRCWDSGSGRRRISPIIAIFRKSRRRNCGDWMFCFWMRCGIGRIRRIRRWSGASNG